MDIGMNLIKEKQQLRLVFCTSGTPLVKTSKYQNYEKLIRKEKRITILPLNQNVLNVIKKIIISCRAFKDIKTNLSIGNKKLETH